MKDIREMSREEILEYMENQTKMSKGQEAEVQSPAQVPAAQPPVNTGYVPEETSLDALRDYAKGALVDLPPFAPGQPFRARMVRPSFHGLIKNGRIPNHLAKAANELIYGDEASKAVARKKTDEEAMEELKGYMEDFDSLVDILAEEAFVKPTWKEVKESGVKISDDLKTFIFDYTQRGVKALEKFRYEQGSPAGYSASEVVQFKAQ